MLIWGGFGVSNLAGRGGFVGWVAPGVGQASYRHCRPQIPTFAPLCPTLMQTAVARPRLPEVWWGNVGAIEQFKALALPGQAFGNGGVAGAWPPAVSAVCNLEGGLWPCKEGEAPWQLISPKLNERSGSHLRWEFGEVDGHIKVHLAAASPQPFVSPKWASHSVAMWDRWPTKEGEVWRGCLR